MAKKVKEVKQKTLEQQLWDSADELRGNLSANQYKDVVLGLVFLKYVNDCFDVKYRELVAEGEGFEEDPDEYTSERIFFVPEQARWRRIAEKALTAEIGTAIDRAMEAIEHDNPKRLKGILPKNYARPELDKRRLGNVVSIFDNIDFAGASARDTLGRVYEYFLGEFARTEGQRGGEFYTPACVVRTIVEVIKPYTGKIYDPACGSGGMFVQSAKFIERHQGNVNNISVYGQELNTDTWRLAQMNLAIRGIEADFGSEAADSFHDDKHPFLKADFVMANPPFNISKWGGDQLRDDPRWVYGIPPEGNANFAWMQHMLYHLSPTGRIGLVLANGSLSAGGAEGEIRRAIVNADLVEGIIAMPSQLFYNVQIPCCLWFLTKRKAQPGKTLFIDARNLGYMKDRTHRELDPEADIAKIAKTFENFRNLSKPLENPRNDGSKPLENPRNDGSKDLENSREFSTTLAPSLLNVPGFSAVATIDDIAREDFVLTPGRYVGVAEAEDDGEPFDEKIARLTSELSHLFTQSREQENEIRKQLTTIGIKI